MPGNVKFIHKVFYCPKCNKEIEPITQISYEDNEKWMRKAYDKLLKYFKPDQIIRLWVNNDNNVLNSVPDIETLRCILFLITIDGIEFKIPCSLIDKKKYWERPIYFKRDKDFNKALSDLKKQLKIRQLDKKNKIN